MIVSDAAGPQEIVNDSTGIKVPMRSPEQYIHDYAEAVVTLSGDARLRERLGKAARQRMVEHHDWSAITQQVLRVYEQL